MKAIQKYLRPIPMKEFAVTFYKGKKHSQEAILAATLEVATCVKWVPVDHLSNNLAAKHDVRC